jgi:hypothetical protein
MFVKQIDNETLCLALTLMSSRMLIRDKLLINFMVVILFLCFLILTIFFLTHLCIYYRLDTCFFNETFKDEGQRVHRTLYTWFLRSRS